MKFLSLLAWPRGTGSAPDRVHAGNGSGAPGMHKMEAGDVTGIRLQEQNLRPFVPWVLPVALTAAAVLLLWLLSDVVLVVFASILVAVAFSGLAKPITRYLRVPPAVAVLIVTLIFLGITAVPLSVHGMRLWAQFDEIALHIPEAIASIRQAIEAHPSGRFIEDIVGGADFSRAAAPVAQHLGALAASLGKILSYVTFMFFGGVYLALDPDRYTQGVVYYTPAAYRGDVRRFIDRTGTSLRMWLFTQLLVVVMNGVFASLGLWAFGVESAMALGILAGALSFIPYVGTIVAMVIGTLATLPQGTEFAFYAFMVLAAASFVEGYLITPYIQSRTLSIPPVVLLFALFAFTILFGTLGIILAAPLTIVLFIALDTFYTPGKDEPPAA
jgi:predicted PurR-regulated permease PerM